MKFEKTQLLLYAVTDGGANLCERVERALEGGVTLVQLREKNLSEAEYVRRAAELLTLCHRYGVPLLVNDSLEVALKSRADGVHVGAEDMSVSEIRKSTGADFIIGATAKTVEAALLAEAEGADYLGSGAMFPSPTKNAVRITPERLKAICASVAIPVAAIGGITAENMQTLRGCGMAGFAIVSALFGKEDVRAAADMLRKRAEEVVRAGKDT